MIPQSRGAMQGARGRPAAAPENRERSAPAGRRVGRGSAKTRRGARDWALHRSALRASPTCPTLAALLFSPAVLPATAGPKSAPLGGIGGFLRRSGDSGGSRDSGAPLRGDGQGEPAKLPSLQTSKLPLLRPACDSTPLICNQSAKSAVPRLGSPTGANQASKPPNFQASGVGAPGGVRTPDPRLRRPLLYPTELQARKVCGQRSAREAQSIHSSSSSWGKARSQKPREMRKSGSCFQPSSET